MTSKATLTALALMTMLSACASTSPSNSTQQRDTLVAQLQAAKQTDRRNALTPGINPIAQGDLMRSAGKWR